jgi:glycosyltransferase involved in cell wall biosynthesis
MACGVPAIACKNGGNLDFMNDGNSYLVDVDAWSPGPVFGKEQFQWRLPKLTSIRARMREAYDSWARGREKYKFIDTANFRDRFSARRIGPALHELIVPFL